ncbi:superoxide dismutase [Gracilibacillus dipsosauri]|uniref:superoxide dismutase n=1 Tax=Gracilibacillus dipsosauri TaxID=178340 RepID=A0A317L0M7_9BACI|nr:superoxide dismutase [Gracilibacillus dipsosauri]PWU69377.1 superoxide dismutase [Gracilibacillus dipsosauri]
MELEYKQYLESLIAWGNDVKQALEQTSISEEDRTKWMEQLDNWQSKIYEQLQSEKVEHDREITALREEGQQILLGIEQRDAYRYTQNSVPYGQHQLPPLPYAYNALEPYISERIMRLHHTKHHQAYVDGLNKAEKALYTGKKGEKPLKHWLREQAFHGSGHFLHTIFWFNMTPNSTKRPSGEILNQIEKDFGSWQAFKKLFTETANSVEGDGWAVLLWEPRSGRLAVQSFEKHQWFQLPDTIPLLVLDVWEHAYYLQYETDKAGYIDNWWNVVNWDNVNDRFQEARKIKWELF